MKGEIFREIAKLFDPIIPPINRGGGTGEASEATASPEFRGFTTEKFLAS